VTEDTIMTLSDYQFFPSLGKALLSLSVSAMILVLLYLCYLNIQTPASVTGQSEQIIPGRYLRAVMGAAQTNDDAIQITGFERHGGLDYAIVTVNTSFRASDFPFLTYKINGRHPDLRVSLIWRTEETPSELYRYDLPWNEDKPSSIALGSNPEWRDQVIEIGLRVTGEPRESPLVVWHLTLEAHSWRGVINSMWSEWTTPRGWNQHSINLLRGTITRHSLSPTVVIAAWAGAALVLLAGMGQYRNRHDFPSYGAVLLIPWIVLDLFWQHELSAQLIETKHLFGGKTTHEKHLADIDSDIYRYISRLKEQVLPPSPSRIFILHNSEGHNFVRLKAQYYLLPHNVFNHGKKPSSRGIESGDYILILGDSPDSTYLEHSGILVWAENYSLKADLIDSDPGGALYKAQSSVVRDTSSVDRPR
jgi:hypothetical protein